MGLRLQPPPGGWLDPVGVDPCPDCDQRYTEAHWVHAHAPWLLPGGEGAAAVIARFREEYGRPQRGRILETLYSSVANWGKTLLPTSTLQTAKPRHFSPPGQGKRPDRWANVVVHPSSAEYVPLSPRQRRWKF